MARLRSDELHSRRRTGTSGGRESIMQFEDLRIYGFEDLGQTIRFFLLS
jgi:hypothetical protein